jgi:anti-anti-sigma factor
MAELRASGDSNIAIEFSNDDLSNPIVKISGEIDISSVGDAKRAIASVISSELSAVTFDLSGVTFMDSSGIALLLEVREKVGHVILQRPSKAVLLVLEAAGVTPFLGITQ